MLVPRRALGLFITFEVREFCHKPVSKYVSISFNGNKIKISHAPFAVTLTCVK